MVRMNNLILHSFSFSNFLSFDGDCRISFVLDGVDAGVCNGFKSHANNDIILSPISVVAGDDRSRANFMKAISFVVGLFNGGKVGDLNDRKCGADILPSGPVLGGSFLIDFEINGLLYRYDLELDSGKIAYESLSCKSWRRYRYLFVREFDWVSSQDEVKAKNFGATRKHLRHSQGCLSLIHVGSVGGSLMARTIAKNFLLMLSGLTASDLADVLPSQVLDAARVFYKNTLLRRQMVNFLKAHDFDLIDVEILRFKHVKRDGEQIYYYVPNIVRANQDASACDSVTSIWLEDRKLLTAFVQLAFLLPALNEGGVVCLDAMDGLVGSEVSSAHLNMFASREVNKKNAQIILATKSIDVLSKVHPRQAYITNRVFA